MATLPLQASVKSNRIPGKQNIRIVPGNSNENEIHVVTEPDVNSLSIDQFHTDFKNAKNATWRKTSHFDEVSFSRNGKKMTAYYNEDGDLVGTTSVKSFKDLPQEGQKQINDEYAGYSLGPVILFRNDNVSPDESNIYGPQYRYSENYFVEMKKGNNKIVVQVNPVGTIYYFRSLRSTIG
jgi:hypothetical protein